ncbi:MAG: hypothetical protein AAF549_05115 [Pseudomonadota bacterium]
MLFELFEQHRGSTAHIAHHVQECYFRPATKEFEMPCRAQTADNVADLTEEFAAKGIPTFSTRLVEEEDCMKGPYDLHPRIKPLSERVLNSGRTSHGAESSAYYYSGFQAFSLHVLSGFNRSLCVLDSVLDKARPANTTLIVPTDCINDAWKASSSNAIMDPEVALQRMEESGAIMTTRGKIKESLDRLTM